MGRGGVNIQIKKKWTTTSKQEIQKNDLSRIAGTWGVNLNIKLSNPYSYSATPVKTRKS